MPRDIYWVHGQFVVTGISWRVLKISMHEMFLEIP